MGLGMDFSKLQPHDVLDIAIFSEQEAGEQYEHLAAAMEAVGDPEVAAFFRKMAGREQLHQQQLAERRQALYSGALPNLANRAVWGIEAPYETKATSAMTPALAFGVALAAEKSAQAYYAAALQHINEAGVARLLEGLRQSEVEHQRMLEFELARRAP